MRLVGKPSEAAPPKLEPLARLPIFLDLRGRRALVVGTGAAAAWKAELLAAAGARVEVFGAAPSQEMAELLTRGSAAGSLRLAAGRWSPGDLEGAAIAVADAADEDEAAAFAQAARAAGVPCNVIDRPAHCGFQFGAIVNRSPVVVGIATAGASPALAQAIRRRIETLLPPALAAWAAAAASLRGRLAIRLPDATARRAFWRRFAEQAFASDADPAEAIDGLLAAAPGDDPGRVTLVGAGPGDPGLLTVKAVRALQSADVVLFDDLVSDGVLELARREARRLLVGKRGREETNALMIRLARRGKRVVRLVAGDPQVFGHGVEAIERLGAAGIPFGVVPGIAAACGLSQPHREHQPMAFRVGPG